MARKMPQGGWPIEEIARVVGGDAAAMRAYAIECSALCHLSRGRFVTDEDGVEWLLQNAEEWGGDPASAFDHWYEQPMTEEVLGSLGARTVPGSIAELRGDGAVPMQIPHADANVDKRYAVEVRVLAQSLVDLLGIVAAQQQQIAELSRQVQAGTVAQIQSRIHEQASEHLHKVVLTSAKALKELGTPVGQVTAGTVVHKGSVVISRSASSKDSETATDHRQTDDTTKVDVGAEVRGLAAKLAGGTLKVKVDTTEVEKRMAALERQRERTNTESFQGELEIQYQGVSVTIGK